MAVVWRLAIRNMFPLAFMQRSTAKTGRMGYALSETGSGGDVRGALALVERNEAPLGIV